MQGDSRIYGLLEGGFKLVASNEDLIITPKRPSHYTRLKQVANDTSLAERAPPEQPTWGITCP